MEINNTVALKFDQPEKLTGVFILGVLHQLSKCVFEPGATTCCMMSRNTSEKLDFKEITRLIYTQIIHQLATEARIYVLGPFLYHFYHHNTNLIDISFPCNSIPGYGIATKFCTYYNDDSTSGVLCAKLCNDRAKPLFKLYQIPAHF